MAPRSTVRSVVVCAGIVCALAAASPVLAQSDLERVIEQQDRETVKGYVQPIVDLFGANMNSGYWQGARISSGRASFGLEVVAIGSLVRDGQKLYTARAPEGYSPAEVETATVFGGEGAVVENGGLEYRFSDGIIEATILPFPAPQIRVGGLLGTEAVLRYIPNIPLAEEDFPEFQLLGVGVRHSISQYLGPLPVDIAGSFTYSTFTFGDYLDVQGLSIGVQAGREFPIVTVYGGGSWERTTMNVSYTSTAPGAEGEVDIDLTGSNGLRLTGGLALRLGVLTLFGDAGIGNVVTFAGGLRLGI